MYPFRSSFLKFAAECDVPVSFASITYRTPEGEPPARQTVCWWVDTGLATHMFHLFMSKGFTAIVNFGDEPVLSTDRKKLAGELRKRVRERFIPVL